jgi:exopolyphosphatase/guanosine-5'-triphosphate,3'-diphosphate pyrophosphatase
MPSAKPVWEWRTFGGGFEQAEQQVRAYPLVTEPRRATHIICDMSGADVRVADGELDVRVPRQLHGSLEQWRQVVHTSMPVDDVTVRRLFGYLDLRPPTTERTSYTLHQFLNEIVAPQHALTGVQVGQIRHVCAMRGCTVDIADLTINGMPSRTLGVEGEDPSAVSATIAELGLAGRPNTNFVTALKQQLAGTANV